MSRVLSVILLPTLECNVACDYCFEKKSKIKLPLQQVPVLGQRLLEHLEFHHSRQAHLYWQGGEVMLLGPQWFDQACAVLNEMAETAGSTFHHHLQTNLIGWTRGWHEVVHRHFGSSLGTSMDYPNNHRRLKNGSTEQYTELWLRAVKQAQDDGIDVGVIAVLHPASLEADPADFYRFFTEVAGITDFQVNMPFPGGPNDQVGTLDCDPLVTFLSGLLKVWSETGIEAGVKLGPFCELVDHFSGLQAQLPCIWQQNCANEFLAVDARGQTALCDCWVTSYKKQSFGNLFFNKSLRDMLNTSKARQEFLERPRRLIETESCRSCEWLSMCHGGCPVRTFTAKGTVFAKDPYCEAYKAIFSQTRETAARTTLRRLAGLAASPSESTSRGGERATRMVDVSRF